MDASGSVGDVNYQKQKNFIKKVAKAYRIAKDGSHAAVIRYSDDASIDIQFGQYDTLKEFKTAVDDIEYSRKRTRIDKALRLASSKLFR